MNIALMWILRLLIGIALGGMGLGMLLDVQGLLHILDSYQLFPHMILRPMAIAMVVAELKGMELLLLSNHAIKTGATIACLLFLTLAGMAAVSHYRGTGVPNWGWFGDYLARPVSWETPIAGLVMFLLGAFLYTLCRRH